MWLSGRRKQPVIRSLIGEGMSVSGDVTFVGGVRIDGDVRGDVLSRGDEPSLVVISEKARVSGTVKGGHVVVHGEVRGAVESSELLELHSRARIHGSVRYQNLEMHQGASIHGELSPLDSVEQAVPAAALPAAG